MSRGTGPPVQPPPSQEMPSEGGCAPRPGTEVARGLQRDLVGTEEALGSRGRLGAQGGSVSSLLGLATRRPH